MRRFRIGQKLQIVDELAMYANPPRLRDEVEEEYDDNFDPAEEVREHYVAYAGKLCRLVRYATRFGTTQCIVELEEDTVDNSPPPRRTTGTTVRYAAFTSSNVFASLEEHYVPRLQFPEHYLQLPVKSKCIVHVTEGLKVAHKRTKKIFKISKVVDCDVLLVEQTNAADKLWIATDILLRNYRYV